MAILKQNLVILGQVLLCEFLLGNTSKMFVVSHAQIHRCKIVCTKKVNLQEAVSCIFEIVVGSEVMLSIYLLF